MHKDNFEELLGFEPYSVPSEKKEALLIEGLLWQSCKLKEKSNKYRNILEKLWPPLDGKLTLHELPYIPASVFKQIDLMEDSKDKKGQIFESSGTTGQQKSKIFICSETSLRQQKALFHSFSNITNNNRVPILFLDSEQSLYENQNYSARNAGVLGFMRLGSRFEFALKEDLSIDRQKVKNFLSKYGNDHFLIFGFTFIVWQALLGCQALDFSKGTLIHSGGWKKMQAQSIGDAEFRAFLKTKFHFEKIINFYGMVEQLGSMFIQKDGGALFAPNFADVIIRCPKTLKPLANEEIGLVQVLSLIPLSYPGHSILTEDLGSIKFIKTKNGGTVKALTIEGRLAKSEVRGCSDTV